MTANSRKTDWNEYYAHPAFFSRFTRRILCARVIKTLHRFASDQSFDTIMEFGGGNSCYCESVMKFSQCREYTALDMNEKALAMLKQRIPDGTVRIKCCDILTETFSPLSDFVFSGGLIEHFVPDDTACLVEQHFAAAVPGGYVMMLFPSPSALYRVMRFLAEKLHLWIFEDERPLHSDEVKKTADRYGQLLHEETIHSVVFSQTLLLYRKITSAGPASELHCSGAGRQP